MPAVLTRDDIADNVAALGRLLGGELSTASPLPPATALTNPADAAVWLSSVRGRKGVLRHPRLALFARSGNAAALQMDDKITRLAETLNSDLQLHEVPAIAIGDEGEMLQAIAYGMTVAQPGLDLLGLCAMADDDEAPAAATLAGLLHSGRSDIAALLGAMIAARLARVPVVGTGTGFDYARQLLGDGDMAATYHLVAAERVLEETSDIPPVRLALALAYLKSAANLQQD